MSGNVTKLAPRPPVILYDMGYGDFASGDCMGPKGVAQKIAQRLGGSFVLTCYGDLESRYPGISLHDERLIEFVKSTGSPSIVFYKDFMHTDVREALRQRGAKLILSVGTNEAFAQKYADGTSLVPHHITEDLLKSEGEKFRQLYPRIKRPLIAVMLADTTGLKLLARELAKAAENYGGAVFYICGSRRTPDDHYPALQNELQKHLSDKDLSRRVKTLCYDFNAARNYNQFSLPAFNPYIGLLGEADHVIVCGHSQSMVSDTLAAGKTAHIFDFGSKAFTEFKEQGLVRIFGQAGSLSLETERFPPVDICDVIAGAVIREYETGEAPREAKYEKVFHPHSWDPWNVA